MRQLLSAILLVLCADAARSQPADRAELAQALNEAGKLFEEGNFAAVVQKLSPWAEKYPDQAEAQHGLGLAYYQQQDFTAASRHLALALPHEEHDSPAWRQTVQMLGMAYYFSSRWPDAAPLLEKASEWAHDDSSLLYALAMSHLYNHDRDRAKRALATLFHLPPDGPGAAVVTGDLMYQAHDGVNAEALYSEVQKKWPEFPGIHYKLGLMAVTRHDYAMVAEQMRAELTRDPSHPLAWHYLGEALAKLENLEEAADALQRAIWLNAASTPSYVALAQVYSEQRKFELAESSLKQALTVDPQNYEANFQLGRLYYKTNRPELAKQQMAITGKLRKPTAVNPK